VRSQAEFFRGNDYQGTARPPESPSRDLTVAATLNPFGSVARTVERLLDQLDGALAATARLWSDALDVANLAVVVEILHDSVQDGADALHLECLYTGEQAGFHLEFTGPDSFVQPDGLGETASEQRVDAAVAGLEGPEMIVVRRQFRAVLLVESFGKANDLAAESDHADRLGAIRGARPRRGA